MSEAEDIERIIASLRQVPEKRLLIIELVNKIPIVNGELDYQEVSNRLPEINLAITEAKAYGANTIMAVESLTRVIGGEEND